VQLELVARCVALPLFPHHLRPLVDFLSITRVSDAISAEEDGSASPLITESKKRQQSIDVRALICTLLCRCIDTNRQCSAGRFRRDCEPFCDCRSRSSSRRHSLPHSLPPSLSLSLSHSPSPSLLLLSLSLLSLVLFLSLFFSLSHTLSLALSLSRSTSCARVPPSPLHFLTLCVFLSVQLASSLYDAASESNEASAFKNLLFADFDRHVRRNGHMEVVSLNDAKVY
jgi:hypothetical protein